MRPSGRTSLGPRIRRRGCVEELPDWEAKLRRAAEVFRLAKERSRASSRSGGERLADMYAMVAASLLQAADLLHEKALLVNMLDQPGWAFRHRGEFVFMVRCGTCRRLFFPQKEKMVPYHQWRHQPCPGRKKDAPATLPYHVLQDLTLEPCKGYFEGCKLCREGDSNA